MLSTYIQMSMAVALAAGTGLALQHQLKQAQQTELESQAASGTAARKLAGLQVGTVAGQPRDVQPELPPSQGLSAIADDLQTLAAQHGVTLGEAAFKPAAPGVANGKVEIDARMKGSYAQIKKVAAGMLAAHEGLALESLSMRRSRSTDALVDADLRFVFFHKKAA